MYGDLYVGFTDPGLSCSLGDTQSLEARSSNGVRLFGWQAIEQTLDIHFGEARVLETFCYQQLIQLFDMTFVAATSEVIDHLVTCDCKQPSCEASIGIVCGATSVDGNERLLNEILDIIRDGIRTTPEEGAQ